jgi:5-amino-6-(5-phospho-D-ribitylamino)uracil phosphatase
VNSRRPDIKLVAIDLDGTLLNDSKTITDETLATLRPLPRQGVKLIIASARPPRSVRKFYEALDLDTLTINYNGALIWDEQEKRPFFHRPLPPGLVRRIILFARDLFDEVLVSCEILDRWYTDRVDQTYTTETGRLFKPDVVAPLDEFLTQPVTKLMLLGDPKLILRLEDLLITKFARFVSTVRADPELLQIMDPKVSKATALKQVADHYGIDMANVMAIGDAANDVPMLQAAAVAIAMDNAHPLVKQIADWVAPSNNDHGVCAALREFGLCR